MSTPQVDVVMPVYNAESYVGEAVTSVLRQSFSDLRLICIDDGSTDGSSAILAELAAKDRRLEVLRQENQGLVGALNAGLAVCTAPLIARMDADDISMPERFAHQVEFLTSHPDILAVGTAILEMDSDGDPLAIVHFAESHEEIEAGMLRLHTGMAHPSVMMRRKVVESLGGYRAEYEWVEDIDLWLRMAERGRLANLPDVLICYRQHGSSGSWATGHVRDQRIAALTQEAYQRRGLQVPGWLTKRCAKRRSAVGPIKWARKASRQGQFGVAYKHLRRQWKASPLSPLTWRMTLEVAARSTARGLLGNKAKLPEIPHYRDAA